MITTQKISTATDKPKVAKVTVRTSNVNPFDATAAPTVENFSKPGVYLQVDSGTINDDNQFVIYYHNSTSGAERYPVLVVDGENRPNNQLVNGTPCSDDPNTYYFPLNGAIPENMDHASIDRIAFRADEMSAGEGWSTLPDSNDVPLDYLTGFE